MSHRGRLLSWLPLANLFQRMLNYCGIARGMPSYLLGDPRRVMEVLPVVRPAVLIAVPRFCERVRQGVMERVTGSRRRHRAWSLAYRLGHEHAAARIAGRRRGVLKAVGTRLADRAVMARVRALFGGRLRFIVSGSAPMRPDVLEWFDAIGLPVLEAYGTSENIVPVTACTLRDRRPGTVGRPVPGGEVRLGADGEVMVRGPGVFDPRLGENAARGDAIDGAGFLHTGDLGTLDPDGYLRLHGRRGDVFKGPDGRWINPADIEAVFAKVQGVDHAAAVRIDGAGVGVVVALAPGASSSADHTARGRDGVPAAAARDLRAAAAQLASASRPRACLVVDAGFSVAGGELTSNLKLRRSFIAEKYRVPLAALVAGTAPGEPPPVGRT